MRNFIVLIIAYIFVSSAAYSQISTPVKRPFNIGVFTGIGGVNFSPIPGVDLGYNKTFLRVAPGYKAMGVGVIREIIPFSPVFYNCIWVASLYGGIEYKDDVRAPQIITDHLTTKYTKAMLMSGARLYFLKRCYSQFQLGLMYSKEETVGYDDITKLNPYFEFSIGINIFKTYVNEEVDE
jgi:hypothetical protein